MTHRTRTNRYVSDDTKKTTTIKTTTVGSGSGLPTPDPEPKKLPDEPPRNATDISPPSREGKEPEKDQMPVISITPTEDMQTIAAILSATKRNVANLERALEGIGKQVKALTGLHGSMKLQGELRAVKNALTNQIERQKQELDQARQGLEGLLLKQLEDKIKEKIDSRIQEMVERKVASKVKERLAEVIPEELRTQSQAHRGRMGDLRIYLTNSESRRRNAGVKATDRLHRLLIPGAISRSSSGSTASTASGLLQTPLESNSLLFPNIHLETDDSSFISPVFPNTVQDLYGLVNSGREKLQQLLVEYEEDTSFDPNNEEQAVDGANTLLRIFGVEDPKYRVLYLPRRLRIPRGRDGRPLSPLRLNAE